MEQCELVVVDKKLLISIFVLGTSQYAMLMKSAAILLNRDRIQDSNLRL